ncbi:MAG: hypothetical protein JNM86_16615 [Phycisphaerae bacterium]|nr:hypothetical protein [Phycisphaerae bacterium]MBN8598427.1 hypothetical protein [Planctomycetota bacterium]
MMPVTTLGEDMAIVIPILGIVFGCTGWFISIVVNGVKDAKATRQREESRREIAAYIAEGTMTAEQGERLMAAGEKADGKKSC